MRDVDELSRVARDIREKIRHGALPPSVRSELQEAYAELSARYGTSEIDVAVRSSWIGIHPMALLHPERVPADALAQIKLRTQARARLADYFIDKLASGVAQIAAAFYPRPVIVCFSDFKTNEYKNLLGGGAFEPTESNPTYNASIPGHFRIQRRLAARARHVGSSRFTREDPSINWSNLRSRRAATAESSTTIISSLSQ